MHHISGETRYISWWESLGALLQSPDSSERIHSSLSQTLRWVSLKSCRPVGKSTSWLRELQGFYFFMQWDVNHVQILNITRPDFSFGLTEERNGEREKKFNYRCKGDLIFCLLEGFILEKLDYLLWLGRLTERDCELYCMANEYCMKLCNSEQCTTKCTEGS